MIFLKAFAYLSEAARKRRSAQNANFWAVFFGTELHSILLNFQFESSTAEIRKIRPQKKTISIKRRSAVKVFFRVSISLFPKF